MLDAAGGIKAVAVLSGMLAIVWFSPNLWEIRFNPNLPYALALSLVFTVCMLRFDVQSPFLYFQF